MCRKEEFMTSQMYWKELDSFKKKQRITSDGGKYEGNGIDETHL